MMEHLHDNPDARKRLAGVTTAGQMRALYDALCLAFDTLIAIQCQPRFKSGETACHNSAGDYIETCTDRLVDDIDHLIFRAAAMVETKISETDRGHLNRMLLHYEARCDQPADEIALTAATLAVKASHVRMAEMMREDQADAA